MKNNIITFFFLILQISLFSNSKIAPPDSVIFNYTCTDSTFWSINSNNQIQEWRLWNGNIFGGNIIINNAPGGSLSYCGNSTFQTFYTATPGSISYYDGTNWVARNDPNFGFSNSGGYKNFQYYTDAFNLYYYNGINATVLTNFNSWLGVGDVSVDALGRAWIFTMDSNNNNLLNVVDNSGTILTTYVDSTGVSLTHAYGMFTMNNKIYLGFGNTNPTFSDSLVPIILTGTKYHFGKPIYFASSFYSFFDLASCSGSNNYITGLEENKTKKNNIFPNPTSGLLNINFNNIKLIEVYNSFGDKLKTFSTFINFINIGELDNGIYYLKIKYEDRIVLEKIILNK